MSKGIGSKCEKRGERNNEINIQNIGLLQDTMVYVRTEQHISH